MTTQIDGPPDNVNEAYFDAMVRHQIGLLRVSGRVRNRIWRILDETERDLADQIRRRLRNNRSVARQEALIASIRALRSDAWKRSAQAWREEILQIAQEEAPFLVRALQTVSPVTLDLIIPNSALLRSIVTSQPFEGKTLRQWASDIRRADLDRIEQQIRIGLTQGETSAVIARRIVGTVRQRGRNGVTEITRRAAEGITRTVINGVTNQAKREFFLANSDILDEEIYVATLDSRTTPVCRGLDGQRFPLGEGPIPPLHFNCRSLRVASIDGEAIGNRPMRNFTERQLLREYATARGIRIPTRRADLPRGHKGQFDDFRRTRIRELTGQVDANLTYDSWLRRQSHDFQDDVLGPTRARIFRRGDLTLDRFVNRQGDELTLAELARRETDAFRSAGLDPEDF